MATATESQIKFLTTLANEIGVPVPEVKTKTMASALIEDFKAQAAVARAAKFAADKAAKTEALVEASVRPWAPGRREIVGTVLTVKEVSGQFGWQTKMLVEDTAGRKIYLTLPAALTKSGSPKGRKVAFEATVQPSNDDQFFAFGSRPAAARFINDQEVAA